jgi:glyoxylase-like metal-dependent hydrolase (beta-lactamase superfamily II)
VLCEKIIIEEVNDCNCYVIACPVEKVALVIDPGGYSPRVREFLQEQGLTLTGIFLTHGHGDHVSGVDALQQDLGPVPVLAGAAEAEAFFLDADWTVKDGEPFSLGQCTGQFHATPGHTPGGTTLVIGGLAFTGDALFSGSVGGTAARADFDRQIAALREKVFSLPDETLIHPGHGPSSTVGVERLYNSFFV